MNRSRFRGGPVMRPVHPCTTIIMTSTEAPTIMSRKKWSFSEKPATTGGRPPWDKRHRGFR
ncbi:hypothetical protein LINPERPRIM_LOCUS32045 [Linum perenne]